MSCKCKKKARYQIVVLHYRVDGGWHAEVTCHETCSRCKQGRDVAVASETHPQGCRIGDLVAQVWPRKARLGDVAIGVPEHILGDVVAALHARGKVKQ